MDSICKPIRFLLLLFTLSAGFLAAQKPCITLDTLPKEKVFGVDTKLKPGATMLVQDGTSFQLAEYKNANGAVTFGSVHLVGVGDVFNGAFKLGSKRVALLSNINLKLTFPNYTEKKVKRICFNFYEGGSIKNLAINGDSIKVIKSFFELQGLEISKGVKVTVVRDTTNKTTSKTGYLCLEGNITSLVIGGDELALDNFCIEGDDSTDSTCSFNSFGVAPRPCNRDGSFLVDIKFQIETPGKTGYYISIGEQVFGPYSYSAPFPAIGPIKPNADGEYEFIIRDADNKECNEDFHISKWKCDPNTNPCYLSNLKAVLVVCQKDSSAYLQFKEFEAMPTIALDSFKIAIGGKVLGIFSYRQLLANIILAKKIFDGKTINLVICSTKNPSCCFEGEIVITANKDCDPSSKCSFKDLSVLTRPCNSDGTFLAVLKFQTENPGKTGYYVSVGGQTFGPYSYGAPFPGIGPIKANADGEYEFIIRDADNKECNANFHLSNWKCAPTTNPCILTGAKGEITFCQKDSTSYLELTLPLISPGVLLLDTFKITVDGKFVGVFGYRQLYGKINLPRKLYPNSKALLVICSTKIPNCCIEANVEVKTNKDCSNPEPCSFKSLVAERRPCNVDGTFLIDFKFENSGSGQSGYFVTVNDQTFGPYRYGNVFPVLGPIKSNNTGKYLITVRDAENKACAIDKGFSEWICPPAPCLLKDLKGQVVYCQKDSAAYLLVAGIVASTNVLDSFKIAVDGKTLGIFTLRQLLNKIDLPKKLYTSSKIKLVICSIKNPNCCFEGEIEIVADKNCIPTSGCNLKNLVLSPRPCNADGTFLIDFKFEKSDTSRKNGYYVIVDNQTFGPYRYAAPFPVIGPIKSNATGNYLVVVRDAVDKNCITDKRITSWKCAVPSPCLLEGLSVKVEISICGKDSVGNLEFKLSGIPVGVVIADTFKLAINGKFIGYYNYKQLLSKIQLPKMPYMGKQAVVTLCSVNKANCCFETEAEIVYNKDCSGTSVCSLKNLVLSPRRCNADGTFLIDFKFERLDTTGKNGNYYVLVDHQTFGPYKYSTPFPVLGPIKPNVLGEYLVLVVDANNKNCIVDKRLSGWKCATPPCLITGIDLKAEIAVCGKDSVAVLEFKLPALPPIATTLDSFKLAINGKFIGYYNLQQLLSKIQLPKLPNLGKQAKIIVCSIKAPNCCFEGVAEVNYSKDCGVTTVCNLKNLVLSPRPCSADGTFLIDFKFEKSDTSRKNGYYVIVNDQTFGPYKYSAPFPVLGPIKANVLGEYLVVVRDTDDKNCATDKRLSGWKCGTTPCLITGTGIKAEINICGKDSLTVLQFKLPSIDPVTVALDSFKLTINGKFIGYYNLKQLLSEVKLPKLPNLGKQAKIVVCATKIIDCCLELVAEVNYRISCTGSNQPCVISKLTAYPTECGSDGKFFIKLEFEAEKPGKKGYQVLVNGVKFGPFPYQSSTPLVGPIKADSIGNYTVQVVDLDSTGCRDTAYIKNFRCQQCPVVKLGAYYNLCRTDGRPTLYFNASTFHDIDARYILSVNGDTVGTFSLNEDHKIILPKAYDSKALKIRVCLPHFPNCCFEIVALPTKMPCVEDHETCLEFEKLLIAKEYSKATGYNPGAKIFEEESILAYIDELKGAKVYGKIAVVHKVDPAMFPQAKGQSLYINNANLRLDFSKVKGSVKQLCFDFFDGSLIRNIAINGKLVGPFKNLKDLKLDSLFKGFTVYFTPNKDPKNYLENGTICIKGDIKTFTIGGEELLVDNFCFTSIDTIKQCDLGLKVKTVSCDPTTGKYGAEIYVTNNGLAKSYSVKAPDGKTYGPYAFDKAAPLIGPFVLSATGAKQVFVAYDTNNPSCADTFVVQKLDCVLDTVCVLKAIKAIVKNCAPNGGYNILLNIDHLPLPTSITEFYLSINGKTYGPYKFSSLPLTLENIPVTNKEAEFEIAAFLRQANTNCRVSVKVLKTVCPPVCSLTNLKVSDVKCDNTGKTYSMVVNLKSGAADSIFVLKTMGGFEAKFRTKDLPVTISGIPTPKTGILDYIVVCSATNNDCCIKWQYEVPCATPPVCILKSIKAQVKNCTPQGNYNVLVNIDYTPTPSSPKEFFIYIDGKVYGPYKFANLPVLVENVVTSSKDTLFEIAAFLDLKNTSCRVVNKVPKPVCPPSCSITDIKVSDLKCDDSAGKSYSMTLNLKSQNTDSILVLRTSAGGEYKIRVKDLPVRITGIPTPKGSVLDYFVVCSRNSNDCCAKWQYELPCQPANCNIGSIKVQQVCLPNGSYYLTLNFDYRNTSPSFELNYNGKSLGEFAYAKLPIRLGPFTSPGTAELKVQDKASKCEASTKVEINLCATTCAIKEVIAKALPCQGGEFFIETTVRSQAADSNKTYLLFVDGQVFGPFKYLKAVQKIGPFKGNGFTIYDILVIDQANPACYGYTNVGPVSCIESCTIGKLEVKSGKCNPDGTRRLGINFEYAGDKNRTFTVFIDGKQVGTFPLSRLPLEESFKFPGTNAQDKYKINVCVNDQKECCLSGEFVLPCQQGLSNDVWPGDANDDNIANHIDLLHIGAAFTSKGKKRSISPSSNAASITDWAASLADDWTLTFPSGLNFKFADCNGDGLVDEKDIEVLRKNYGYTHGTPTQADTLPYTSLDPDVLLEMPPVGQLPKGSKVDIPIVLGSELKRVKNIYGVAFTIKVDPKQINLANVEVIVPTSWMGQPKVNMESIYKVYPKEGLIEMALTRIDQNEVSGYGPIAFLRIIKDDIVGRQESQMLITDPRGIQVDGTEMPLAKSRLLIPADQTAPTPPDERFAPVVQVYPNPVEDILKVSTTLSTPITQLQVFAIDGKVVLGMVNNSTEINVGELASGVYILRIQAGTGIFHQRFAKK